jgi:YD repeat-containing protein
LKDIKLTKKRKVIENRSVKLLLVYLSLVLILPSVLADDTYKPYLHNAEVPKNPGLNLPGAYQTALWPGAATYDYPIIVPPGRNGLQPSLSLSYNSHLTSQRPSITGSAWTLAQNYITRDVNYTFASTSDDKFKLVLNGQSYDLIYNPSEGRYHTKIESYLFIQNLTGGNNTNSLYWIVKSKDGTVYRLGYNPDSELVSNMYTYTTKWNLDLINDTHNNQISYSYRENPYTNDLGAVYPYKIEYNNEKSRVIEFKLDSSDRPDMRLVYEQGNKIRESRRIKEIEIQANNALVRRYQLDYIILDTTSQSFISTITLFGSDNTTSLPSTSFEYYNSTKGWKEENIWTRPNNAYFEEDNYDRGVRALDLNRDGLLDLVRADQSHYTKNNSWINNGTGWYNDSSWNVPTWIVDDSHNDVGIRFIDVNGDGFTDIVKGDGTTKKTWINTGSGWSSDNATWHLPTNAEFINSGSSVYDRGVRFIDFNDDGMIDILSVTDDWNYAWRNIKAGWVLDNSWRPPSAARFILYPEGKDEGVRIEDINGDGLPDLVKGEDNDLRTWINNGTNWYEDSSWTIPAGANFTESASGDDSGARLADVNSDGLIDLLKSLGGKEESWINNGTNWVKDSIWNVPETTSFIDVYEHNIGVKLIDVNGDGLVDVVNGHTLNPITFINRATKSYFLKVINNTYGGSILIDYTKSTGVNNSGIDKNSDMGFNLWLVNYIVNTNSMPGAQKQSSETDYNYENGYYDYSKHEFRGFGKVDEIIPQLMITKHWYHQNESLGGMEYKSEVFDTSSNPYHRIENSWRDITQNNTFVVSLTEKTGTLYDMTYGSPKITRTQYSYDNYGNILLLSSLGDNNSQGDEKYEYWKYVYNINKWIVSAPTNYSVYDSDNSTKVSETYYAYDNLNYGSSPTKGDLSWKSYWLSSGNNPSTNYSYDTYGNLVAEINANGYTTNYTYGLRDTTYTILDQVLNPKNQLFKYYSDLGTGNKLAESDANGYLTNYTYDLFGRIEKEILPYDSLTYPTKQYTYTLDGIAPEIIKISQRENNGTTDTLDTYYFYDGNANLLQIKSEAESGNQTVANIYYDQLGRVSKQSNPYFITGTAAYSTPDISISGTNYTYDPLGRVISVINPDNSIKNSTFSCNTIISYDENNNKLKYYTDAYGQIIKVIEYTGNNYYITKYNYDALNNLIKINDSNNNIMNYSYDSLGRKIGETNGDSGTWTYIYDNEGNIIRQVNNKGINTFLEYDQLNRIIKKNSSNSIINYTYDKINGTLWQIVTPELITNYTYDNRLQKIRETNVIDNHKFVNQWGYDSLGRLNLLALPDNSVVNYNYTTQGHIEKINAFLTAVLYNALGKPQLISYGNNLSTEFNYNQNTYRIQELKTSNRQELDYSYDNVGNIVFLNDSVNNRTNALSYDSLDRLISLKQNVGQDEEILNYTYDPLGNLLRMAENESLNYYYGFGLLHAPRRITMKANLPPVISNQINYTNNQITYIFSARIDEDGQCTLWGNWSGNWIQNETKSVTSLIPFNFTSFTAISDGSTYLWGINCSDSDGNIVWGNNYSFTTLLSPHIQLSLSYPTQNLLVTQNEFFRIISELSCFDLDCGEVNLTLNTNYYGAPVLLWNNTLGGGNDDNGRSIKQISSGDYIISGGTKSYGLGDFDVWLLKLDFNGILLWNRTFGGVGYDIGVSAQQTTDGGYILGGYTSSFGAGNYDYWLIKTDSTGNAIWNKTYGGAEHDYLASVQQTSDGGYILGGSSSSFGAGNYDYWLIKTDSTGNTEWNKTYGGPLADQGGLVQQTTDGGYILSGGTYSYGAGNRDILLIKLDSLGNQLWNNTFGGIDYEHPYSTQQTDDNGYVIIGRTYSFGVGDSDVWLLKVDSNGNLLWNNTFGGNGLEYGYSISQADDGSYIIGAVTSSFGAGDYDVWLIKTDSIGRQLWNKTFGGNASDSIPVIEITIDNNYVAVALTLSNSQNNSYDLWVMKAQSDLLQPISSITGVVPFYTNISFPNNYTLIKDQNQISDFFVNATGIINYTGGFSLEWNCELCNPTHGQTNILNVTIVTDASPSVYNLKNFTNDKLAYIFSARTDESAQCTLYGNWSGSWAKNETKSVTAYTDFNYTAVTLTANSVYIWAVNCSDAAGNHAWSDNETIRTRDTIPPSLSIINLTDSNGEIINNTNRALPIENATLNINIASDTEVDSVWITVWETVASAGNILWQGLLSLVSGNLFSGIWSAEIPVNTSFSSLTNYTVYANDTLGNEANVSGNFSVYTINDTIKFYIRNSTNTAVAWFGDQGNVIIKGVLTQSTAPTATANDEFRVQDSTGADVMIVDQTNGNMYLNGQLKEGQAVLNPVGNNFIVKDASNNPVAYVNESGYLLIKGILIQNGNP